MNSRRVISQCRRMPCALILAGIGLVAMDVAFSSAAAATRYVDKANPQCSDSGSGTAQAPFCTISKGASVAVAGDTVQVASGTYSEQVSPANSGASGAPIVFTAAPGATVTVSGNTNGFTISSRNWITVRGFTVSDTTSYGISVQFSSNITLSGNHVTKAGQPISGQTRAGIYLNSVTDSLVSGNTTDFNSDAGIYLVNNTTRVRVERNIAHDNARGYTRAAPGIDVRSGGNTIVGNISHDNEDTGIQLYSGASNNLVVNNLCYHGGDHGIDISSSPGNTIIGNTVYLNATSNINVEGSTSNPSINTTLANNISVDNDLNFRPTATKSSIRVQSESISGTTLDYDLAFQSQSGPPLVIWGSNKYSSLSAFAAATGMEVHGLQADPLWADRVNGDFHLTAGSPAIDSANSGASGAQNADIESKPRVDDPATPNTGAGPRTYDDRGAYEFQVTSQSDTSAPTVPTGLTATAVSPSQINLAWTASTDNVGVAGYKIFRNGVQVATSATTAYSDTGLTAATTYSYSVAAFDAAGNTSAQSTPAVSATTQASADTTPPSAPTGLTATAVSPSQINLAWTASTDNVGVAGYKIFRNGVQVATSATTAYSDTGLTAATTYSYSVAAFDAAGNTSAQSTSAVSATTQASSSGATLTFTPTDDARILSGSPTTNYGSSSTLAVDGSPIIHSLLKFTVTGITTPVLSAKLRIYNTNDPSANGGDFYRGENNDSTGAPWSEKTVTWNTAPAYASSGAPIASLGQVNTGTWYEVDISSLITGNGTYNLRFTSSSSDGANYASKENTGFAPQLVITVQ